MEEILVKDKVWLPTDEVLKQLTTKQLIDELARRDSVLMVDADKQTTVSVKVLCKHAKSYTIIKNLKGKLVPNGFLTQREETIQYPDGYTPIISLTSAYTGCTCEECRIEAQGGN